MPAQSYKRSPPQPIVVTLASPNSPRASSQRLLSLAGFRDGFALKEGFLCKRRSVCECGHSVHDETSACPGGARGGTPSPPTRGDSAPHASQSPHSNSSASENRHIKHGIPRIVSTGLMKTFTEKILLEASRLNRVILCSRWAERGAAGEAGWLKHPCAQCRNSTGCGPLWHY